MSEGKSSSTDQAAENLRGLLEDIKIIATGGMAQIFRARQPSLDRFVVIKRLKDELISNPETQERFRREAKALASVLHQNVAHVYDFVETPREAYILMEYIDGVDLSTVIEKMGHLPAEIAAIAMLGVAKGVSYIHGHHLIHRDIKPSNIRLTTRGEVKLMDFGIAVDTENQGLTRPGMMVGSPFYLSPEQVLGDPISTKADLFLLGICLYESLTGSRPFRDENGQTVYQRIRECLYIPAKQMQSTIPSALDRIIKKCLSKDPDARYDSVKDLISALEKFLGPEKSARGEDILLKFLDGEALLTPSVPYKDVEAEARGLSQALAWKFLAAVVGVALLVFCLGFLAGRFYPAGQPETLPATAKPLAKPLNR